MFGKRHRMSLTEESSREVDKRIEKFNRELYKPQDRIISAYMRQYNDGEVVGYTTQYINGRYVGIRGDSQGLYFVQVGFSAEGAKTSGWVTHEEANKFIYENTKG